MNTNSLAQLPSQPGPSKRQALAELDPNKHLNTLPQGKRLPISFEPENEDAVVDGIRRGLYDFDEVIAWTDHGELPPLASVGDAEDSDDDQLPQHSRVTFPDVEISDDDPQIEHEGPNTLLDDDDDLLGEVMDEDIELQDHEPEDPGDSDDHQGAPVFDAAAIGLKEINNLAHFGVSSHKPGNGVEELLSDDLDKYWQSDGQQPHLLTIHFLRRVEIRAIRFYVDYDQDESYTPTNIVFYAGTGGHDLIQFAEVPLEKPVGWQEVPIAECGGGADGHSLCCWIVQIHVKENHQNGKDTHIRGIKIYALDESLASGAIGDTVQEMGSHIDNAARRLRLRSSGGAANNEQTFQDLLDSISFNESQFSTYPDFMREPEIR